MMESSVLPCISWCGTECPSVRDEGDIGMCERHRELEKETVEHHCCRGYTVRTWVINTSTVLLHWS